MAHTSLYPFPLCLYVSVVYGDDRFSGQPTRPFRCISAALEQAIAGSIIYVAPGRYSAESGEQFPLIIPSDVVLVRWNQGHDPADLVPDHADPDHADSPIIIDGGGAFFSPTAGYQTVTLAPSHRSIIQDLTITNPMAQGTGIWVESAATTLRHCRVTQCQREGIVVTTAGSPLVQDCQFDTNQVSGLLFWADATGTVERCIVQHTDYGIAIRDRAAPTLVENRIMANRVGLVVAGQAKPILRRNYISQNQDGLVLLDTVQPDLGTSTHPGHNEMALNQRYDIQSQTATPITAWGNYLPASNVQGALVLEAPQTSPTPVSSPNRLPVVRFPDCETHWSCPFIEVLHQQGVIQGFPDGTFHPDEPLTRAQYAALLTQLFELPAVTVARAFQDVEESFWAAVAIRRASEMGFIAGFPDGTVRPDQALTRVQAMVSVVNGLRLTGGDRHLLNVYRDRATIPAYATGAVVTATDKSLVVNYPDPSQLEPDRPITRAEMATLLYQVQVITGRAGAIASPFLVVPPPITVVFEDVRDIGNLPDRPSLHWADRFIHGLAERRLIRGIAPSLFAPERAMSRAEFATLLAQLFNPLPCKPPRSFVDVPTSHWAAAAIQRVTQADLMTGFDDGSFQPQQDIKRWQLLLAVVKALALPVSHPSQLGHYYTDLDSVPVVALGAIATATQHQLVINYPHLRRINGNRGATRAEVAAILYQSLALSHRLPVLRSPYVVALLPPPSQPVPPASSVPTPVSLESSEPSESSKSVTTTTDTVLPAVILSPVSPIQPIADIEQYLFGYSNQAQLIAQSIAAQLQQQGIEALIYHPHGQAIALDHHMPTTNDILVRIQILDLPPPADQFPTPSPQPLLQTPSIEEVAWQVALFFLEASSFPGLSQTQRLSQRLAQALLQRITTEVGLGDRGLHPVSTLWPDWQGPARPPSDGVLAGGRSDAISKSVSDATATSDDPISEAIVTESTSLLVLQTAVFISVSPMQIPADDYPPIPIAALVRVLVDEIGDRFADVVI